MFILLINYIITASPHRHVHCIQTSSVTIRKADVLRDVRKSFVGKQDRFGRDQPKYQKTCKSESWTRPGVQSKHPRLACHIRCKYPTYVHVHTETSQNWVTNQLLGKDAFSTVQIDYEVPNSILFVPIHVDLQWKI